MIYIVVSNTNCVVLLFRVFFLRLVYPMLLVSLDCPFLIAPSVFSKINFSCVLCTLCCRFLWIVHFWLPLRYSLTFIFQKFRLLILHHLLYHFVYISQTSHWKDALKILKLAVTRSSTLTAAPPNLGVGAISTYMAHTSFAEAEIFTKKELPGL